DNITDKNIGREKQTQALITEEKIIKLAQFELEKSFKQRDNEQAEKFRKLQTPKEIVADKYALKIKEEAATRALKEEANLFKAIAEQEAQFERKENAKKEKKAATLQSISDHCKAKIQENDLRRREEHQRDQDWCQAQKESGRLFLKKAELNTQKNKNKKIKCQDFNAALMADEQARLQQLKSEEHNIAMAAAEEIAKKDKQLHEYVQSELSKAADSQRNSLPLLTASTGRCGFMLDGEEPINKQYMSKGPGAQLLRYTTNQTRNMKQHLERDSLQLTYIESGTVDPEPTRFSHISKTIGQSADMSILKETTRDLCSPTVGVEGSAYRSQDTGESLPRRVTKMTQSVKQRIDEKKLDLTYQENSYFRPTPPPPIPTNEVPAGCPRPPPGVEASPYCSVDRCEPLPRRVTVRTRRIKEQLERNRLKLTYIEAGEVDQEPTCIKPRGQHSSIFHVSGPLPSIPTNEVPAGCPRPPPGVEASPYCSIDRCEPLPRRITARTRAIKQQLERNNLQLTYVEAGKVDQEPTVGVSSTLPPMPTKEDPAGRPYPPPGMEASPYRTVDTCEPLPRKVTARTRAMKQEIERNNLQLTYIEAGKVDQEPQRNSTVCVSSPLPSIPTKEVPAGRPCPPPGMEASPYRTVDTCEPLPRKITARTRAMKQNIERNNLQLTYKEAGKVDQEPQRNSIFRESSPLTPIPTREVPIRRPCPPPAVEGSPYRTVDTCEPLPRRITARTRAMKQHLERNSLQLTYKEAGKVNQLTLQPVCTKFSVQSVVSVRKEPLPRKETETHCIIKASPKYPIIISSIRPKNKTKK
ncbi:uncharacterized protein LOC121883424 isoform X5, partial [Scomber scombrus]